MAMAMRLGRLWCVCSGSEGAKRWSRYTRFEVRLNQRLADDFDQVARASGLTRVEVFRRAIALYKMVNQEESQQVHVILRSKDGAERELVNF